MLAEGTDAALVDFQVDTYWVFQGGANPADEILKLGRRVKQLHQKDLPKDEAGDLVYQRLKRQCIDIYDAQTIMDVTMAHRVVEIGEGVIDIEACVSAGIEVGAADIILEHDEREPGADDIASLAASYKNFSRYTGVNFP